MFQYLGEGSFPNSSNELCTTDHFYYFNMDKHEYLYRAYSDWDITTTDMFEIQLDDRTFYIPSNYYVLIGGVHGEVDWICIDEAIGRPIDILVFDNEFRSWKLTKLNVTNVMSKCKFYWPFTKHSIPTVSTDGKSVVLLSTIDQHKNTRDHLVDIFIGG